LHGVTPPVADLFAAALEHHQAGRLAEAERRYYQILQRDPRHADSLHLLGVLAYQRGDSAQAVDRITAALKINSNAAAYHYNLANALEVLGRHDEAIAGFEAAVRLQPNYPEAHYNLGNSLNRQKRLDAAVASFRRSLLFKPDHAKAHNNLGAALAEQGKLAEAIAHYQRALALRPDFAEAHNNLGAVYREQGRLDDAIACYRRALALRLDAEDATETETRLGNMLLDQGRAEEAAAYYRRALSAQPEFPEAHNNLGAALEEQGELDAAVECYHTSLKLKPDFAKARYNLGIARFRQGRHDEAVEHFHKALALQPGYREAHNNLGCVLLQQGRLDAAIETLRRAVELQPQIAESHHNLSLALLAAGQLAEGWVEHEWRWKTEQMLADQRGFSQPQWRGEPAAGKVLLIHAEQGFGDTLHFCRYAPLAAARGLRVHLEVPAPLVRLLRSLSGIERVIPAGEPLGAFDLHCPMLSLPLAFGTTLATIPAAPAYLSADPAQAAAWRNRLSAIAGSAKRIGLVWAGNPRPHQRAVAEIDRRRSMPPAHLAPLRNLPGCHFFSLQKDHGGLADLPMTDFMAEMNDFADTAALIVNLDLVISVDTAVSHLAAALGKPVWLLDRFDACWRWLRDRRDSPWYPSLRIYRQPAPGDWDSVVAEIRRDLLAHAPQPNLRATLETAVQHHRAGRLAEAEALYREVLTHQPRHADSLHLLGVIADQTGRHEEAVSAIRAAIAINPGEAVYHYNLGIALTDQGKTSEAMACYQRAIDLNPDYAEAHNNLGLALRGVGRLEEALARHQWAIALRPGDAKAYNNLGITLRELGRLDEAVAAYRQALALQPDYPDALNNIGIGLKDQGHLAEALVHCRRAVAQRPDFAESHYNLGTTLLTAGELPEGWREFEWRWQTAQLVGAHPPFTQPQWRGEPASGQTLLIHAEQGYGDAVQFCRYATLAAERGVHVYILVHAPLVRLMRRLPGVAGVLTYGDKLPHFDWHCPMLSLPLAFGTDLTNIPASPYLSAEPADIETWRIRLAALPPAGLRVGLVWSGNPRLLMPAAAAVNRRRSMPPEQLAPLYTRPDIQFFSLQKDAAPPENAPLIDLMAAVEDFADTAALITHLDLVISVDTAVAHVAAALGKPVWLLDRFDACWRWLRGRTDSPWYPSLRLYRQPAPGDWDAVVASVARDLAEQRPARTAPASAEPEALYLHGIALGKAGQPENAAEYYRRAIALRPDFAEAHHNLGAALMALGRAEDAIPCYHAALAIHADFPEAHSNLGTALLQIGKLEPAIACFRQAITQRPSFAAAQNNLGAALRRAGALEDALAHIHAALALQPEFPEAHSNLGATLRELGRFEEAFSAYHAALTFHPENAELLCGLGIALAKLERFDEAVACYRAALARRDDFPDAHQNLATALRQVRPPNLDEAIAHYRQALALRENFAEVHTNLGTALWERGETDAAIICHRRALELRPDFADAYNNLGAALIENGQLDDAEACYHRALALNPEFQQVHNNLGLVLRQKGQVKQGLVHYRQALKLNPGDADARVNLAMALLADGDLAAGWREYEWRLKKPHRITSIRPFTQPQWQGEPGGGRTLLIHPEQGYGDTLQFCRYAPRAAARGFRVVLEVQKPLARLMRSLAGVAQVVARGEDLPPFDVHSPIMSLPLAFGTTLATIPSDPSYLHADAEQAAAWRARLDAMDNARPRVGLVWAGNPRLNSPRATAVDRRRSMPPEQLAPLLRLSGLHFVSLQKDGPVMEGAVLSNFMHEMEDFADTAALIANLDLVISVDTAVAHLAASLGKPVWLLDRFDACWRWLRGRRDSPWYPTLRLYRQPRAGDWESVIAAVAADLRRHAWRAERFKAPRRAAKLRAKETALV
jgi:tetratricopeptide (TPR) repeat protein